MKIRSLLSFALLSASLFLAAPAAHAQRLGINGSVYFPTSSKTKNAFGSNFNSIGPGIGSTEVPKRKLYPDFDLLRVDERHNKATVVFAGAKLLMPLGGPIVSKKTTGFAPYGGFGVNLAYADINAKAAGINDNGFGVGTSAILGASFGPHFYAEGTYRLMTSAAHFNFSGGQIELGLRF